MGIEGNGVCMHVLVHVPSDYGVVREGGRVGRLIEEATRVVDAARCMERAECDEEAGVGGEVGMSDGAGVDLPELGHGGALAEQGEVVVAGSTAMGGWRWSLEDDWRSGHYGKIATLLTLDKTFDSIELEVK